MSTSTPAIGPTEAMHFQSDQFLEFIKELATAEDAAVRE
jgi:hypothetical protein